MPRHHWKSLNKQQVGAYAEYFVKMELTMHGFQVYSTEVDDRGIDFVARREIGPFIEIQVKSLRAMGYVFVQKTKFPLRQSPGISAAIPGGEAPENLLIWTTTPWTLSSNVGAAVNPTLTYLKIKHAIRKA